ncbi:MAG: hypothetical protein M0024_01080 [Nitrospiraceae bacterium]|nr:hypothetical protein [Nitrospiraceae bacterium]
MNTKPAAIELFEKEQASVDQSASISFEHPMDRLRYHILETHGKILKSEFPVNGISYVIWESQGKKFKAWSSWPEEEYKIHWQPEK